MRLDFYSMHQSYWRRGRWLIYDSSYDHERRRGQQMCSLLYDNDILHDFYDA